MTTTTDTYTMEVDTGTGGGTSSRLCHLEVPRYVPTIGDAIELARVGDVICVGKGTYNEDLFIPFDLQIVGDGPSDTTLVGSGTDTAITISRKADEVLLQGFTVTGGRGRLGGAIGTVANTTILRDMVVRNNLAYDLQEDGSTYGGGVDASPHNHLVLENVDFIGNRAEAPKGGRAAGGAVAAGSVTAKNVRFIDNRVNGEAGSACGGGALSVGDADLRNTIFIGNSVYGCGYSLGGAIGGSGVVENSTFVNNTAENEGGAFSSTRMALRNTTVSGSRAHWHGVVSSTAFEATYSNFFDNGDDPFEMGKHIGLEGNISVDPMFVEVSAKSEDIDVSLGTKSPLVDQGDPELVDPDGSRSDIGAFGGGGAADW